MLSALLLLVQASVSMDRADAIIIINELELDRCSTAALQCCNEQVHVGDADDIFLKAMYPDSLMLASRVLQRWTETQRVFLSPSPSEPGSAFIIVRVRVMLFK